jgi:NADH:ubiquinone oxidoreductase subunit E
MTISPEQLDNIALEYKKKVKVYDKVVKICCGTGCISSGSLKLYDRFKDIINFEGLSAKVLVKKTGCHGLCERGPVVVFGDDEILYQSVGKRNVDEDAKLLI